MVTVAMGASSVVVKTICCCVEGPMVTRMPSVGGYLFGHTVYTIKSHYVRDIRNFSFLRLYSMYACKYVCTLYLCAYVLMYQYIHVCLSVCMYICMYNI